MPALIAFLGGLVGSLATWLTRYVTKRVAVWAAFAVAFSALWVAFWAALTAAASLVASVAPSGPGWDVGFSVIPQNAAPIAAAVLAVRIAKWVYLFASGTLFAQLSLFK